MRGGRGPGTAVEIPSGMLTSQNECLDVRPSLAPGFHSLLLCTCEVQMIAELTPPGFNLPQAQLLQACREGTSIWKISPLLPTNPHTHTHNLFDLSYFKSINLTKGKESFQGTAGYWLNWYSQTKSEFYNDSPTFFFLSIMYVCVWERYSVIHRYKRDGFWKFPGNTYYDTTIHRFKIFVPK